MCFALPLKVVSSSIKNAIMEDGRKVDISIDHGKDSDGNRFYKIEHKPNK